jgi:predicted RND superfamily exporter protein
VALLPAQGVFVPFLVVILSLLWTWGIQAALGIPVYIAGIIMPPILLAIGCADGIHVLERYNEKAMLHGDREKAVVATMQEMWRPVVITSVTTAIGFAALLTGKMAAFQVLGAFSAVGIITAMFLSLTLIPALLMVTPLPRERGVSGSGGLSIRVLGVVNRLVTRHSVGVGVTGAVLAVVLLGGATLLRIDFSWVESLAPGTPVLEADRYLRERHGGTMPLNIIVRAPEAGGIKEPGLLRAMDTVLGSLARDPDVGDTRSIAEYVKRMNQVMSEDRPEEYRIPDGRDLVAQYLFLHTISAEPGELDDMVDYDYQLANMSVLLRRDSMATLDGVLADTERLLDQHLRSREGVTATVTGAAHMMHLIMLMVLEAQVYSLTIATALVFVIMMLLFRSLTDTLFCMVPSAFAAIANFGVMGMLGVALGPTTVIISAIALGIGVDYAIHLVTRFRELSGPGIPVERSLVQAMQSVGCSIMFNAMVVVAGFAVLVFSESPANVMLGTLVAFNMATTAVAALVLLPALLLLEGKRRAVRGGVERAPWLREAT